MDTREKIVGREKLAEILSNGSWAVVAGRFDPLTLIQAERLAAATAPGRKVLAIVHAGSGSLLAAHARAALVAALRGVDAVTIADEEDWKSCLPDGISAAIFDDSEGERARSAEFVEFVIERQRSADGPV